jgi:hypothetical protein
VSELVKNSNPSYMASEPPAPVVVAGDPRQEQGGNRFGADFCRSALPANRGLYYDGGWQESESGRHIAVESPGGFRFAMSFS